MRTVILHRPPGVGKLTVAKELPRPRRRLLDSHLFDAVEALSIFGAKAFVGLRGRLRSELLIARDFGKASSVERFRESSARGALPRVTMPEPRR